MGTDLVLEMGGLRRSGRRSVPEEQDRGAEGDHAHDELHQHQVLHAVYVEAVVVIRCEIWSDNVSSRFLCRQIKNKSLPLMDDCVTNKKGMICPMALPIGAHMEPIVVAISRSVVGNQIDAIAGGEFKNMGWPIAANACPRSITRYAFSLPQSFR
jgi:hypothetical protein